MRNTRARQNLIKIFNNSRRPLSVRDIIAALKKAGLSPNKTTVYRQIEKLTELRFIKKLRINDGGFSYELNNARDHHHHIICNNCEKIQDVIFAADLARQERTIARKTNFSEINHNLEFYGICSDCRN